MSSRQKWGPARETAHQRMVSHSKHCVRVRDFYLVYLIQAMQHEQQWQAIVVLTTVWRGRFFDRIDSINERRVHAICQGHTTRTNRRHIDNITVQKENPHSRTNRLWASST